MLRRHFGQPHRVDEGLILKINSSILAFCDQLAVRASQDEKYARLDLFAGGFIDALNELEQSMYCSQQYSRLVTKATVEEMSPEELDHYRLHVYYYKNAVIRIFSTLDKLGYFINELFVLNTEKVKEKYSYFTVLRTMYKQRNHPRLEQRLFKLKVSSQEAMSMLRKKRNLEVHYINAELIDDLKHLTKEPGAATQVENLQENMERLGKGYVMVSKSLDAVFAYANDFVRSHFKR